MAPWGGNPDALTETPTYTFTYKHTETKAEIQYDMM